MVLLLIFLMILIVLHLNLKKITDETGSDGKKEVPIIVPLKYFINFSGTLEMPVINCETNIFLTWSAECVIVTETINNQVPKFAMTDKKIYVPVVSLSAQGNAKLL